MTGIRLGHDWAGELGGGSGKAAASCLGGRPAPAEPGPLWSWGIFPTPSFPSAFFSSSLRTLPLEETQLPSFFLREVLNDGASGEKPGQEAVFRRSLLQALSTNLSGPCLFLEASPARGHSPGGLNTETYCLAHTCGQNVGELMSRVLSSGL